MSTKTIKQGISYLTNDKGKQTAVVFDLKNKAIKDIIEDFMDTLESVDALNEPSPRKPIGDVRKNLLSSK